MNTDFVTGLLKVLTSHFLNTLVRAESHAEVYSLEVLAKIVLLKYNTIKGEYRMEVKVDQELCISCGLCVSQCPDIFVWNARDKAEATTTDVKSELEDCVQDAADGCPTDAIETN